MSSASAFFDSSCPPSSAPALVWLSRHPHPSTSLGEPEVPCAWQSLARPCRGRAPMPIPGKGRNEVCQCPFVGLPSLALIKLQKQTETLGEPCSCAVSPVNPRLTCANLTSFLPAWSDQPKGVSRMRGFLFLQQDLWFWDLHYGLDFFFTWNVTSHFL